MSNTQELDVQIEKLRKGDTLAENEVKALCEKVSERSFRNPSYSQALKPRVAPMTFFLYFIPGVIWG